MTSVSVVIPYRGQPGFVDDEQRQPAREAALEFVHGWWRDHYPDWDLTVGYLPSSQPWVKALAVGRAVDAATGDLLVVADADVICEGVGQAVDAVLHGSAQWAVPHYRVHRLTEQVTAAVLGGAPLPPDPGPRGTPKPFVRESYTGMVGGGLVVLPRELYERVPLDPRFVGWGLEDSSLGIALSAVAGKPYRGLAPLWHLWHPPQPRLTRAIGSHESLALYERYRRANGSPELVSAILAEILG